MLSSNRQILQLLKTMVAVFKCPIVFNPDMCFSAVTFLFHLLPSKVFQLMEFMLLLQGVMSHQQLRSLLDLRLKSHPKVWRRLGSNPGPLVYKASG